MNNSEGSATTRPIAVALASIIWIALGVLLFLLGAGIMYQQLVNASFLGILVALLLTVFAVTLGVYFCRFGASLRHGRDLRRDLTIMGLTSCVFVFPAAFAVLAIALQYLPSSRRWFANTTQ